MRKIENIVIHCADTPKDVYFDIDNIRKWHVEENGWVDVGYHFIILLDGTIQIGRPLEKPGAHVKNHNKTSIGICYIGGALDEDTRTVAQKASLVYLIGTLKRIFKEAKVLGHRDFENISKYCPSFDAKDEYKNLKL